MGRESSLRPRPSGMTLGRWMLVAMVAALIFTLARIRTYEPRLQLGLGYGLFALACARVLVILLYSKRCTVCGKGPVGMVAAVPFGDHFFRCSNCGQRSKRFYLGRLWDASGPRDDRRFRKAPGVATWSQAAIEPTPDRPETRTVGGLLASKIDRDAERPAESVVVGTIPRSGDDPATPPTAPGVETPVTERFARTLDVIRWARRSRT